MILASPEGTEEAAYLRGMKHGMEWLLSSKGMTNAVVPYCVPSDLPVPTEQFRQILSKQVTREPADGGKPAGLVLLKGLRQAFPCPSK
ncbi:Rap1a/Tai family immunity protein [Methylobacterium sp.]|uniref:Rap1a/Tai family immunity protein n=1 Tax=Methylobacterium sp. TaxID=409 RepID=UPI0025E5C196|nr:Rap1a/Tai family immunity protein [Methylobacterium sp.]MBY0257477.1 hypothetical protein [Methylobacterium sp.]